MKYHHSSKHRKSCHHDPDSRAQLGFRLRASRCNLGWSISDAAKYFQVTERTWHNWETGAHRIPFAVYKLARVLANLELPGDAWAGWSLQGGKLITPEGRQISPQDGSWWSLLVRQAACFRSAFDESTRLRLQLARVSSAPASGHGVAVTGGGAGGLVSSKTNQNLISQDQSERRQNDVIMETWPIPCDSLTPSTLLPAPERTIWVSPSMPSFVSPWTPTCGVRVTLNRPPPGPHLASKPHLKQVLANQPHLANPSPSSPSSSPEPKNRPLMRPENGNLEPSRVDSARPAAAAQPAKLASAARGTP